MQTPLPVEWIDSTPQLEVFCAHLGLQRVIGIDTEFVRERTYHPVFCLLQISTADRIACLDPLTLPSLAPLRPILEDPARLKILHSGRQDLEVLLLHFGELPQSVVDTQTAAALAGYSEQIGYANLVDTLFNVRLAKEHTRTDWSRRPLSPEQIAYAAEDVSYLIPAHEVLSDRLATLGRDTWLDQDCRAMLAPDLYENSAHDAWKRVSGSHDLPAHCFTPLKRVAEWREKTAQQLNLPRAWILKDDQLCTVVRSSAVSTGLQRHPCLSRSVHIELIDALQQVLQAAQLAPAEPCPPSWTAPLDPTRKALLKRLMALVHETATDLGISPATLASRRDLEALLDQRESARVLKGWRKDIVGDRLALLLPTG